MKPPSHARGYGGLRSGKTNDPQDKPAGFEGEI
jgi:hypothetical protein